MKNFRLAFYTIIVISTLTLVSTYLLGKTAVLDIKSDGDALDTAVQDEIITGQILHVDTENEPDDADTIIKEDENKEGKNQTEISSIAEEIKDKNSTITTTSSSTNSSSSTNTSSPAPTPVSPSGCPASTLNCIPCNTNDGHWACRVEPGETLGFLGWSCQNNNPGNIRYSTARISYITKHGGPAPCGERIDSRGGTYMIFSTYQDGRNALKAYMKAINAATHTAYSDCADGTCSLSYVFSKYAPGDPNYAQNVADKIGGGVTPSTDLSWVIANKFDALINAIQAKEGFFTQ